MQEDLFVRQRGFFYVPNNLVISILGINLDPYTFHPQKIGLFTDRCYFVTTRLL
jgi:hypothetical protein